MSSVERSNGTETPVDGGREVTRDVDLGTMPLYARSGAIVPFGPVKQFAAQQSDAPIRLKVYGGANGTFRWYEDDGSSFGYQRGDFTRIECAWNEGDRTLTLRYDPRGKPPSSKHIQELAGKNGTTAVTLTEKLTTLRM